MDQEEQLIELFDELLTAGRSPEEIRHEWAGKSHPEILRAYAVPESAWQMA